MPLRRYLIGSSFVVAVQFLVFPHAVLAAEIIRTYSSHIEIGQDASVNVQEEIVYDFGAEEHHGIYRIVPLVLMPLGKAEYNTFDISNIFVTDGHGKILKTTHDNGGNAVTLTIGDPGAIVTGAELYVIHYTLRGTVTSNLINDQFDWDVFGGDWQTKIVQARAEVIFPKEVRSPKVIARCALIGDDGKQTECDENAILATTTSSGFTIRYTASNTPERTHFLIQAVFPKGAIVYKAGEAKGGNASPRAREGGIVRWWQRPFIDFSLVVPFIVFFILLALHLSADKNIHKEFLSAQKSYLIGGIALFILSFFVPLYNLALLLTAVVIAAFGIMARSRPRN